MTTIDLDRRYGDSQPIAIIGAGARFPKAPTAACFWRRIADGEELTREITAADLEAAGLPKDLLARPDYVARAGILEDADAFDAAFFGFSPQEAASIDPQQRIFLTCCWEALDSAGYGDDLFDQIVGVYGAARMSTYRLPRREDPLHLGEARNFQALIGNDKDYLTTRVAYKLGLTGPALTVQTACSSSLVAVHLAAEQLRAGECDMALAGGVGVTFPQATGYLHQPGMIFSKDGRCRPFDANADGTVVGNGAGVVLLKPLDQALRDGDPVLAVIRGSAINNDGKSKAGFTAPSVEGQIAVLREAYAMAAVDPSTVEMIEAHGTATALGDAIEIEALRTVFAGAGRNQIALGSVKSNLGHADTAAGIASLLKAIMALHHRQIPPNLHVAQAHPDLRLEDSPFMVPATLRPWAANSDAFLRRAGVSSFGIGGTNCHVVLEESPVADEQEDAAWPLAIKLSSTSAAGLRESAERLVQDLLAMDEPRVAAMARSLWRQQSHAWRLALAAEDLKSLIRSLFAFAAGDSRGLAMISHQDPGQKGRIALLFTGQGDAIGNAGATLRATLPGFRAAHDRCSAAAAPWIGHDLAGLVDADDQSLQTPLIRQAALVAFEIAMAETWISNGFQPDFVLGHSLGEIAAACVAGMITLEDAFMLVAARADLADSIVEPGSMALLRADRQAVLRHLAKGDPRLVIAADNGLENIVISGPCDAVQEAVERAASIGIGGQMLTISQAFHSPLLDPVLSRYEDIARRIDHRLPQIPIISTVTAARLEHGSARHWRTHLREEVRFAEAVSCLAAEGVSHALEVGPTGTLCRLGRRCPGGDKIAWIPAREAGPDECLHYHAAFAAAQQAALCEADKARGGSGRRLPLPPRALAPATFWNPDPAIGGATASSDRILDAAIAAATSFATVHAHEIDPAQVAADDQNASDLHAIYGSQALLALGLFTAPGERWRFGDILRRGRIEPRHRQLVHRLLRDLVASGHLIREGDHYRGLVARDPAEAKKLLEGLRARGDSRLAALIQRSGEALASMLTGEAKPAAVIFLDGSSDDVEDLYQNSGRSRYLNGMLAAAVAAAAGRRPRLNILEVGAGTGGTTAAVLEALPSEAVGEYRFTDVGPLFLKRARAKFAAWPFMRYAPFDMERDPIEQGLRPGSVDLIIAANVLHNARSLEGVLKRLHDLLTPGGLLVLREITEQKRLFDVTFGPLVPVLEDIDKRQGELFASRAVWESVAQVAGFATTAAYPPFGLEADCLGEHVILLARTETLAQPAKAAPAIFGRAAGAHDLIALLWQAAERDGGEARALREVRLGLLPPSPIDLVIDADRERIVLRDPATDRPVASAIRAPGSTAAAPLEVQRHPIDGGGIASLLSTLGDPVFIGKMTRGRKKAASLAVDGHRAQLLDANGCPVLDLKDVVLRRAGPPAVPSTDAAALGYAVAWKRVEIAQASAASPPFLLLRGPFLPSSADDGLAAALRAAGSPVLQGDLPATAESVHVIYDTRSMPHDPSLEGQRQLIAPLLGLLWSLSERPSGNVLTILTSEAVAPCALDMVARPELAGLVGLVRTAASELPMLSCRLLDLDADADDGQIVQALLGWPDGETVAALRDELKAPRLQPRVPVEEAAFARLVEADKVHLLTGGLSALGIEIAHWLGDQGARRLIMTTRRELKGQDAAALAELRRRQIEVELVPCDLADQEAIAGLLRRIADQHGRLGSFFHLAGHLADGAIRDQDWKDFETVLAPKWLPAQALEGLDDALQPRLSVFFSSAASIFGPPGQAAHASANALLEGLAQHRTAKGHLTKAIAWGLWASLEPSMRQALADRLAAIGMLAMPVQDGLFALEQALYAPAAVLAAMRVDWQALLRNAGTKGVPGFLAEAGAHAHPADDLPVTTGPAFAVESLLALAEDELPAALEAYLKDRIAALLQLPQGRIQADVHLVSLGLDSLMFLDLSQTLSLELGVPVTAETALEHDTIEALAGHLAGKLAAGGTRPKATGASKSAPAAIHPAIAALKAVENGRQRWLDRDDRLLGQNAARHDVFAPPESMATFTHCRRLDLPLADRLPRLYAEWDLIDRQPAAIGAAWRRLISRHDMLRASVMPDGTMITAPLDDMPPPRTAHLVGLEGDERDRVLEDRRQALMATMPDHAPACLALTRLSGSAVRMHLGTDRRLIDDRSFRILLEDLWRELDQPDFAMQAPLPVQPRDYHNALAAIAAGPAGRAEQERLADRLRTMPAPPRLSLLTQPSTLESASTSCVARSIDALSWQAIERVAARERLPIAALPMAALGRALGARQEDDQDFALTFIHDARLPLHPAVASMIGAFGASWPVRIVQSESDPVALARSLSSDLGLLPHDLGLSCASRELATIIAPSGLPVSLSLNQASSRDGPFGPPLFAQTVCGRVALHLDITLDQRGASCRFETVEGLLAPRLLDAIADDLEEALSAIAAIAPADERHHHERIEA